MGPNPPVLAAILVAMRFEEISCLRVSFRREASEHVGTSGEVVATGVEFKVDPQPEKTREQATPCNRRA
jgi:hypothetical protein